MPKTIEVPEITDKKIDEAFDLIKQRFKDKIKKKGRDGFVNPRDGFAKLTEEMYEVLMEMHAKDWDKFTSEVIDVGLVSALIVASSFK